MWKCSLCNSKKRVEFISVQWDVYWAHKSFWGGGVHKNALQYFSAKIFSLNSIGYSQRSFLLTSSGQNLQRTLERLAAECEVTRVKVSRGHDSQPEKIGMFSGMGPCLRQRSLSIWISSSRVMAFWSEMDGRIGASSSVMRALLQSVVVKRELSREAALSIYWSIFVPILTYGHETWVVTERTRSRIQADYMGFLWRVAGFSLRDGGRSSE